MRLCLASQGDTLRQRRAGFMPGMVHLGVGAFHRAHVAAYVDEILTFDPHWAIIGASLRSPGTRAALAPQDFLYTHVVRDGAGSRPRLIASLLDVLEAGPQRDELLAAMLAPATRIVTLTITEKGYGRDPASGALDLANPDIAHDLVTPDAPGSAIGLLVQALALRKAHGTAPFTILSCDNLPANGETAERLVKDFAARRDPALADYIAREVAFPSSMVDRIVPATTDDDRALVKGLTGFEDAWPVMTEPFSQWVIEDRFCNGRPDFARVGVEMVADVRPYELMKLRLLNGSHSTLAYLGYLAGHATVSEAIAAPEMRHLISRLMTDEVIPTLPPLLGDLRPYRDRLLARFANPALKHRTWQIAMDGSQKLPQRLLGPIRERLAQGAPITLLSLGVAGWMRYVTGHDEQGGAIEVKDPLAQRLRSLADSAGHDAGLLVRGLLSMPEIFGNDLPQHEGLVQLLTRHVHSLFTQGASATIRQALAAG